MYDEAIDVKNAEEVRSPTPESTDSNFEKQNRNGTSFVKTASVGAVSNKVTFSLFNFLL